MRATVTSKGQVTIPKSVREALELHEGDELLFRVQRNTAVLAKTPDFLELAGQWRFPPVSAERHGTMCSAGLGASAPDGDADGVP